MEGSVTQLGLKNYLINDKIKKLSFFNHSYQNFANYAKDTRALTFLTTVDFGQRFSFKFDKDGRYGDLISNITLQIELPSLLGKTVTKTGGGTSQIGYTNSVGNAIIKQVQLKVGGNIIDTQYSEYMDIWSSFSIPSGKQLAYAKQVKKYIDQSPFNNQIGGVVYIPLFFWFCQNTNANIKGNNALAFPLAGMRNAEIELIIEFRTLDELVIYEPNANQTVSQAYPGQLKINDHKLLVDYITLESEERMRYLDAKKQLYLITQTQRLEFDYTANTTGLNINLRELKYPVTELIWVFRSNENKTANNYFNYSNGPYNNINNSTYLESGKLIFDSRDRIPELPGSYFTDVEPFKVHDNVPPNAQIHVLSFALEPENLAQPTGSCNFSGIHEPRFQFKLKPGTPAGQLIVYAINYNVLQVDNRGNVWLLHNLSKSTPNVLPDPTNLSGFNVCDLTVEAERTAKELVAKINKFNIYRDPRQIESGLANRILEHKIKNNLKIPGDFMPYLDALRSEIDKLALQLSNGRKHIIMNTSGERVIDIGGRDVPIENVEDLIGALETNQLMVNTQKC
jgi:hypothetical protein